MLLLERFRAAVFRGIFASLRYGWRMTKPSPHIENVELLIDLLKVATRVAAPMIDAVADPEEISKTELRIILALGGEGPLAGHELAHLLALQPMNISRALVTLEGMGLVEKIDNAQNRRRKPFGLTAAGQAKLAALEPRMEAAGGWIFSTLTAKERAVIGPLLKKLDGHLMEWETPEGATHITRR